MFDNDPFVPVIVNKQQEAIRPNNIGMKDSDNFFKHNLHEICDGPVQIRRVSLTHKVLFCECGLRRYFPKEIETYGSLRKYFVEVLELRPARDARRKARGKKRRQPKRRKK